jgi:hypothetical protein
VPEQPVPPPTTSDQVREAQRLNECISRAGNDSEAVFACFDEFQRRTGG